MRRISRFAGILATLAIVGAPAIAQGDPTLRVQVNQRGDFVLIGNSTGQDCAGVPPPAVGTIGACGGNTNDSAPDVFWTSDQANGTATADNLITAAGAGSTAMLTLPAGATVTYARVYWAAMSSGMTADPVMNLDRNGVFSSAVSADTFLAVQKPAAQVYWYQSSSDVTALVQMHGAGAYQATGIDSVNLVELNSGDPFVGWSMVVFYQLATDPMRNLALFDGLDYVTGAAPVGVVVDGFYVPAGNFDAKVGVIAYEGDLMVNGDALLFNGTPFVDPQNLVNDFFNSSRSRYGVPVSVPGDLPQLPGTPRSMSGLDLDVIDVKPLVSSGDDFAFVDMESTADPYLVGGVITAFTTLQPDFVTSTKEFVDVNGGAILAGDVIEYTITATNTGNDTSDDTQIGDEIPPNTTYVPGSLKIVQGPGTGAKTDMFGDDQADFDDSIGVVFFRVGSGADDFFGGNIMPNVTTKVAFRVTVNMGESGLVSNQGLVRAAGLMGAPYVIQGTDGNGAGLGSPPTEFVIDKCATNADCVGATPFCDTSGTPNECVACTGDGAPSCPQAAKPACQTSGALAGTCGQCSATNSTLCVGATPICLTDDAICGCSDLDGDSECGSATSGVICNGPAGMCVSGCSVAAGRNDCPDGQQCSDQLGGVGICLVSCASDLDCTVAPLLTCDVFSDPSFCVECLADRDCPGTLVCDDLFDNSCVECTPEKTDNCSADGIGAACLVDSTCGCLADDDCGALDSGRICDVAASTCVPGCRGADGNGCPADRACTSTTADVGQCVECLDDAMCPDSKPFCELATNVCVNVCMGNASCPDPQKPVCQTTGPLAGACTECSAQNSAQCTSSRPVCLPDQGVCGCVTDSQCGKALSGKVCDAATSVCVDGCRGLEGNGCPSSEQCTSIDATIGLCEPDEATSGGPKDRGPLEAGGGVGCACSTVGAPWGPGRKAGLGALILAVMLWGRRRSRAATRPARGPGSRA